MDLDLRDLRYFQTIAELGHLGRAAEQLGRSQPALTKCVHRLEETLGAELFESAAYEAHRIALGVPRDVVRRDYLLTNERYPMPVGTRHELPPEAARVLWRVQPDFLLAALHRDPAGFEVLHQAQRCGDQFRVLHIPRDPAGDRRHTLGMCHLHHAQQARHLTPPALGVDRLGDVRPAIELRLPSIAGDGVDLAMPIRIMLLLTLLSSAAAALEPQNEIKPEFKPAV